VATSINRRGFIKLGGLSAGSLMFTPALAYSKEIMINETNFDVIIVGGSYAGLSAAMALGRALRHVLIVDGGLPCNRQTPHSHNFITHDGEAPHIIRDKALSQVLQYKTVSFMNGLAISARKTENGFWVQMDKGTELSCSKLIFASGIKDILPEIEGFAECWGISLIHCPYCHGYEYRHQKTGILANADAAMHYARLINNWSKDLHLFTNGKAELSDEQKAKLAERNISVTEKEIARLKHEKGQLKAIVFTDHSEQELSAAYYRPAYEQHSRIPQEIGCELTEQGLIRTDFMQKTIIPGLFVCGDNSSMMRSVASAVAAGNVAGAMANHELTEETF